MQISKKTKVLVFMLSLMTAFFLGAFYKTLKVIKYAECERIVFRNPGYKGGADFKTLHEECMKR